MLLSKTSSRRSAFTLVELLIVISIMGILATVMFIDFRQSRQRQAHDLMLAQVHAELQHAHTRVASGRFGCEGLFFSLQELPQVVKGTFSEEATCEDLKREDLAFEFSQSDLPSSMSLAGFPLSEAWVLFIPPNGDLLVLDGQKAPVVGEFQLNWGKQTFRLSDLTEQIYLEIHEEN